LLKNYGGEKITFLKMVWQLPRP